MSDNVPTPSLRKRVAHGKPKGFMAFSIVKGITMHINLTTYDYVRYHGKIKNPEKQFDKLHERDKIIYSIIEKNCDNDHSTILQYVMFYVTRYNPSCLQSAHKKVFIRIADLAHDGTVTSWEKHKTEVYAKKDNFTPELDAVMASVDDVKISGSIANRAENRFMAIAKNPHLVFHHILAKGFDECGISFQTLTVIDKLFTLTETIINNSMWDDTPVDDMAIRVNKLSKLYQIETSKYEQMIFKYCKTYNEKATTTTENPI